MSRSGRSLHFLCVCALSKCAQTLHLHQCSRDWKNFQAGNPLVSSQRVRNFTAPRRFTPHFFERKKHQKLMQGVTAFPEKRFAFCSIEKVGCSMWDTLLPKIASHNQSALKNYDIKDGVTSLEDLETVFNEPNSVRAVFVREPLSRFVSAFLDKCFGNECTDEHCYARPQDMLGKPISFSRIWRWMLRNEPASLNGHWTLQSEHCQLRTRIKEYNWIGLMTKETFAHDSRCILERAGLEGFDTTGDGSGTPLFTPSPQGANKAEEDVLKKLFTPEAARSLIAHLHADYETFNFPHEPSWVAEATGEWFDYVPTPDSCRYPGPEAAYDKAFWRHRMPKDDENDDIVAMAARAGFPVA